MAEIYFVRHGETDWNEEDKLRGWSDIPLNEDGQQEAQQAASFLAKKPVLHIVAADLPRVIQTARPIAESTGAPLTLDRRYRDMDYGDWTGVPVQRVLPQMLEFFRNQEGTPPGGQEDYADMITRVTQAFAGLVNTARQVEKGIYVVVSSNRISRSLLAIVTGDEKFQTTKTDPTPNGGVVRFAQEPGLEGYGDGSPPFTYWGWESIDTQSTSKHFEFGGE